MVDVRGDVLRPPHGTTPAKPTRKMNQRHAKPTRKMNQRHAKPNVR